MASAENGSPMRFWRADGTHITRQTMLVKMYRDSAGSRIAPTRATAKP